MEVTKFTDIIEPAAEATAGYREIKPNSDALEDNTYNFWDEVFGEEISLIKKDYTDVDPSEVYGHDESEFSFPDFDYNDAALRDILKEFKADNWYGASVERRDEITHKLVDYICDKLGIENPPKVSFYSENSTRYGYFSSYTNEIKINRNQSPADMVNTAAHELRHAYQYQRACIGETHLDRLYAYNFEHYISPKKVDGYYVNYVEYQEQLLEAEARAFANGFKVF